ncbi:hypothetical protein PGB90_009116 [Kerria lacca]
MPNNKPVTVDQLKSILDQFFNEKFGFLENIPLENKQLKEKIQILEERMDSIESYFRRNNIIVHGVPRQENENPLELALEICKTTGTEIESYEIDEAHRMPSRNREISLPFIIKLTNRFKKSEIMKNYKKKKRSQRKSGKRSAPDLGFECREHLPLDNVGGQFGPGQ